MMATYLSLGLGPAMSVIAEYEESSAYKLERDLVRGSRGSVLACYAYLLAGDLHNLLEEARQGLHLAEERNLLESHVLFSCFAGIACYHQNKLDLAESYFAAVTAQRHVAHPIAY